MDHTIAPLDDQVTIHGGHPADQPNPLVVMLRLLRGRFLLTVGAALLIAVPVAVVTYMRVPVRYASVGVIRVAATLPRLLYKSDENQVLPLFDAYVSGQASHLTSRRVLDMAVNSQEMRDAGWPAFPDGLAKLASSLRVHHAPGTELITASVTHEDPRLARIAINAVLDGFAVIQKENAGLTISGREEALIVLQEQQDREIEALRGQMTELASAYGTDDLDQLHAAKVSELVKLDGVIAELDRELVEQTQSPGAPAPAPDASPEQLAEHDRTMAWLLERDASVRAELDALGATLTAAHPRVIALTRQRDSSAQAIEARVHELQAHIPVAPDELSRLRPKREAYIQMREDLSTAMMKMGRTRLTLATLRDRLAEKKARADEVSRELAQIRVESPVGSIARVSILQRGDVPYAPTSDRRTKLAAAAGVCGGGMGALTVLLLCRLLGGYRYIDELEESQVPMTLLGTIPDLVENDPERQALTQLSVHHLRHMLQAQGSGANGSSVYTVTSACAGDGKTSIAYALAVSFAAAGVDTIVVDADLVGCGLSRQLGLLGVPGLREAIPRCALNGEIHQTGIAGLWALPVGIDPRLDAPSLSPALVAPLLERLRARFSVVVLDTGPILGSLEASVVARVSDRVVLVVSRGQSPRALKSAAQQVRRLGAVCAGLVFNRAATRDFDRSTSVGSFRSRSVAHGPRGPGRSASLSIFGSNERRAREDGGIPTGGEAT